ncbi:MAG: DUF5687 family protein [Bacteroidales bacterium]|nr:DUF5687 family protein [Bacteroidales bacterium]
MILTILNRIYLKEMRRSPMLGVNRTARIFMGISLGIMVFSLFSYGIMASYLLGKLYPERSIIESFSSYILYALVTDLIVRLFFQRSPGGKMASYLCLPIRKKAICHFLQLRSLYSPFNFYFYALILPFLIQNIIADKFTVYQALFLFLGCSLLILTNNSLAFLVHKVKISFPILEALPYLLILLLGGTAKLLTGSFEELSIQLGLAIFHGNVLLFAALLLLNYLLYHLNSRVVNQSLLDEIEQTSRIQNGKNLQFGFLDKFGEVGQFMILELKLQTSGKIKRVLIGLIAFTVMAYFQVNQFRGGSNHMVFFTFFWLVLGMQFFGKTFTQFGFALESTFFDLLMMHRSAIFSLLKAKYFLYVCGTLVMSLAFIPMIVLGYASIWVWLGAIFYVIGIQSLQDLISILFGKGRIELTEKPASTMSGYQTILAFVTFIPVFLIGLLAQKVGEANVYGVIIVIGVFSVLLSNYWLTFIYRRFVKKMYTIAATFRK